MRKIWRLVLTGTKRIEDMTEEEAKIRAMLIDTEGCITTMKSSEGDIHARISVGMRSRTPVDEAELWGGTLTKRFEEGNIKYTWNIDKRKLLRAFLLRIKPYLKEKQKQAELALKMCNILDVKPDGYIRMMEELRNEISRLNHALAPDIDISKLKGAKKRKKKKISRC